MSGRLHVAVFEEERALVRAIRQCQQYGLEVVDAHTPYPVHGLEEELGLARSRLGVICFLAGLVGITLALWFQNWASASDWPLNVGGKPFDSLPAFMPVAFEMLVLCAGLGTAAALLVRSRLFPGKAPRRCIDGVTDDRFAVVVRVKDASVSASDLGRIWSEAGAVEVREEEDD